MNNPLMTNNYKNYSYSLIAMNPKESDSINYINSIIIGDKDGKR